FITGGFRLDFRGVDDQRCADSRSIYQPRLPRLLRVVWPSCVIVACCSLAGCWNERTPPQGRTTTSDRSGRLAVRKFSTCTSVRNASRDRSVLGAATSPHTSEGLSR